MNHHEGPWRGQLPPERPIHPTAKTLAVITVVLVVWCSSP